MQERLFISDFDNTISRQDFYQLIIEGYLGEEGKSYYKKWKEKNKIGIPFLKKIFSWHKFSKIEHDNILNQIKIDPYINQFKEICKDINMDIILLSAGMSYYIDWILEKEDIELPVITNKGSFNNGYFTIEADKKAWYYSSVYGVDKGKVIAHYKKIYKEVLFAGDSEPDYTAAIEADICFAKSELADLLNKKERKFYSFKDFKDIIEQLNERYENEDISY